MKRLASAALPALLAVLIVAGCGGGTTTKVIERTITEKAPAEADPAKQTTAEQEPADEGAEAAEAPSRILHLRRFRSPSGNIGCAIFGGGARCDIRKRDWKPPPKPSNCSLDYGQGLSVSAGGEASFVCAGDTTLDPRISSLAYGTASQVGGIECVSREAGISCVNQAGHGFFISVQSYQVF